MKYEMGIDRCEDYKVSDSNQDLIPTERVFHTKLQVTEMLVTIATIHRKVLAA